MTLDDERDETSFEDMELTEPRATMAPDERMVPLNVFHKGFLSEFTVSGFCCHAEKFSVFTEAAMNECLSFNHLLSRA